MIQVLVQNIHILRLSHSQTWFIRQEPKTTTTTIRFYNIKSRQPNDGVQGSRFKVQGSRVQSFRHSCCSSRSPGSCRRTGPGAGVFSCCQTVLPGIHSLSPVDVLRLFISSLSCEVSFFRSAILSKQKWVSRTNHVSKYVFYFLLLLCYVAENCNNLLPVDLKHIVIL